MTRLHHPDCRWERTTPAECEYRDTHHYCPHREHACDCALIDADRLLGEMAPEPRATDARPTGHDADGMPFWVEGPATGTHLLNQSEFNPDWSVHPGETLGELIEERGWTQAMLARQMGVSYKHLNQIVHGRVGISPDVAILLERETGVTADFWIRLDGMYRLAEARKRVTRE